MTETQSAHPDHSSTPRRNRRFRQVFWFLLVIVTLVFAVVVLQMRARGNALFPGSQFFIFPTPTHLESPTVPAPTFTSTASATNSPIPPSLTPTTQAQKQPDFSSTSLLDPQPGSGTIFLSINENGYSHIFAYHPQALPLTRLTAGAWDDIDPAASPDGQKLAFASNRDGFWDLYLLNLLDGSTQRLTSTHEYDGAPSWSPDGQWLAYETYTTTLIVQSSELALSGTETPQATKTITNTLPNLEIYIQPLDGSQTPINLTYDPDADHSPSWSPGGRQVAFVSDRSGENEIWVADLDRIDERFRNISQRPAASDVDPSWSPDGSFLAWSSERVGFQDILLRDLSQPGTATYSPGAGIQPAWSPDGDIVLGGLPQPNQTYLTGYFAGAPGIVIPPISLPGRLNGLTWSSFKLSSPLADLFSQAARLTPTPAWLPELTPEADIPNGRQKLVTLPDVDAPYPILQDLADEAYNALRTATAERIGWDFLASLENAFVPLTSPLFPGMFNDWLYTGRAFSLNPVPINAGWLFVAREEYGASTFWRVYLRTRFQDGSQGQPLRARPWDFSARYNGKPQAYEQGGAYLDYIPVGYWVDFTDLAKSYGWERLPALSSWRYAVPAARFNEFIIANGQDWYAAMSEIYPAAALVTPTPVLPPTFTPTVTRRPTRTPTPTRTPWPTRTPTSTRTPSITPSAAP